MSVIPTVSADGVGAIAAGQLNAYTISCYNTGILRTVVGQTGMTTFLQGTNVPNDGGQGSFYWDYTSTAADNNFSVIRPYGVIYGAWLRTAFVATIGGDASQATVIATGGTTARTLANLFADVINVLDFGADPTGSSSSTTAISNAITAANTAGGKTVFFPAGHYLYTASAAISVGNGITLLGESPISSVIITNNAASNIFDLSGYGARIQTLGFQSNTTQTSGTFITLSGAESSINDFRIQNDFNGILVTGPIASIENGVFAQSSSGGKRIIFRCGDSAPSLSNIVFEAQTSNFPAAGLSLQNCASLYAYNLEIITQGTALEIIPGTGQSVSGCVFDGCFFDTSSTDCVIQPTGTGLVLRNTFTNTWSGGSTTSYGGITVIQSGSTIISGLYFINHTSVFNINGAAAGISLNGSISDVRILGGLYANNGNAGIYAAHTGDISIIGAGLGALAGFAGNGTYGIVFGPNVTSIICSNNYMIGNTSGDITDTSSSTIPKFITDNVIPGYARNGAITVGASPFAYTAPYNQTVYITGGTVSGVVVNSATNIFTSTNCTVVLRQGENVTVTYSVIPFMNFSA
jgi:hypothetical protein